MITRLVVLLFILVALVVVQTVKAETVFIVNSVLDSGDVAPGDGMCDDGNGNCTLRAAIEEANLTDGSATITIAFAIPGSGVHTITPATVFPTLTRSNITIDGTTQAGATCGDLWGLGGAHIDPALTIKIDGNNMTIDGLVINGSSVVVRGLSIERFANVSLRLERESNNAVVQCNTVQPSTSAGDAMFIGSTGIVVGGDSAGEGNVFSGVGPTAVPEQHGLITAPGSNATIQGNFIGTDASGTVAHGFSEGIVISGDDFVVGGTTLGARNLISGSVRGGISDEEGDGGKIEGNYIGTDITGTRALPNMVGIMVSSSKRVVTGMMIGGTNAGAGNLIAYNTNQGIQILGTNTTNAIAILGNTIRDNGSSNNTGFGIDLGSDFNVTPNDDRDIDSGPNGLQNFPVLTSAVPLEINTTVSGSLESLPSTNFRLEFFQNTTQGISYVGKRYGEGKKYLGFIDVTTDSSGAAQFTASNLATTRPGYFMTATASRIIANNRYETSEFSASIMIRAITPPTTLTVNTINDGSDANLGDGICDDGTGHCTLRAAIEETNILSDADIITFNIPGSGSQTITLTSDLPEVSDPVTIDGTTQPGSSCGTPSWKIAIDASGYGGVNIMSGNSVIKGFEVKNNQGQGKDVSAGLVLMAAGNNTVQCMYLHDNQVGLIVGSSSNIVGGTSLVDRNFISNNSLTGIGVVDFGIGATDNVVQGNVIGLSTDGRSASGNGYGVLFLMGASGNTIGGMELGAGNIIANNINVGVSLTAPELGRDVGYAGIGNSIFGNSMYNNGSLGIALSGSAPTPNDLDDADTGPNNLQNYPTITRATGFKSRTVVAGKMQSTPNQEFRVEFFWTPGSATGQGKVFLGYINVTTNKRGRRSFIARDLPPLIGNGVITATATDRAGNTSEFSLNVTPRMRTTLTPSQEAAVEREFAAVAEE